MKNLTNIFAVIIFLFICLSCSTSDEAILNGGNVEINIQGVSEGPSLEKQASINNIDSKLLNDNMQLVTADGMDALVGIEVNKGSSNDDKLSSTINGKYVLSKQANSSLMKNGIRYQLFFYEGSPSNPIFTQVDGIVGTRPVLSLDVGKTYYWFAVSKNSTDPSLTFNPLTGVENTTNEYLLQFDQLYTHGVITVTSGTNYLNVIFKRQTVAYEVELDVQGVFGTFNTNEIPINIKTTQGSVLAYGPFNFKTGSYVSSTNASTLNTSTFGNQQDDALGKEKTSVFLYSNKNATIGGASNNLLVNYTDLSVKRDDGITIVNYMADDNTNRINKPISTAIHLQRGDKIKIPIRFIESALTVQGVKWARTNLRYDVSKNQKYRFRSHNNYALPVLNQEYWHWRSLTPAGTHSAGDPCLSVYPGNVWRLPTWEEFKKLLNKETNRGVRVVLADGQQYYTRWALDSGTAPADNNAYPINSRNLYIQYFGYYDNYTKSFETRGSDASYPIARGQDIFMENWTSTTYPTYPTQAYTFSYYINNAYNLYNEYGWSNPKGGIRSTIRCVRN